MKLIERLEHLEQLFRKLELTPSRNEKIALLRSYREKDVQLSRDINYAFEILDGRHKVGYTFNACCVSLSERNALKSKLLNSEESLEEYLQPLYEPKRLNRFDAKTVTDACVHIVYGEHFVARLINRLYKLGIGNSQLSKDVISPMLGKHINLDKIPKSSNGYFITEKLDGNRCIAKYNQETRLWEFFSRSGKRLRVAFDMNCVLNYYIFDGEIMMRSAWEGKKSQEAFNCTSGKINSKYGDKSDLVYVIFDILNSNLCYAERRVLLNGQVAHGKDVVILPLIAEYSTEKALQERLQLHLDEVTSKGGEGLMINLGDRFYEHKRTDAILKVKEVQTMDMRVLDLLPGTGKNEGLVGSLECFCKGDDGKCYSCNVGSGLSDEQRYNWAEHPEQIMGKIIEVAYFSVSQDAQARGTNNYALRFPRLKRVRIDKNDTSEH